MPTKLRVLIVGMAVLGTALPQLPLSLTAQEAPPTQAPPAEPPPAEAPGTGALSAEPQAPAPPLRTAAELDTMLAPIALYPDPLLAQILPAATVPGDVVMADRYVKAQKDPAQIDQQPWNESVKALARYPDVLKMMDDKLDWTTELGEAYLQQPDDVFASVQHLRSEAATVGNLKDSPQQVIVQEKEVIKIMPADPQVIYVPTYPPTTVYTTPPVDPAVPLLAFGAGLAVGVWLNNDHDDYWYGRGNDYHGNGYHNGGYYGGNNTVNINNNNNVNIGNGNVKNNTAVAGNGNRPANGGTGANRPNNGTAGAGNGNRPNGGAGAGNGNRPGNGANGAGNGGRPNNGAGNGARPGNGAAGAGNARPGNGAAGAGNGNRPSGGAAAGGARPATRPSTGAQRPASGGGAGSSGFSRDASKQRAGSGSGGGGRSGAQGAARSGGGGAARGGAGAARGGGGGGAARGGGGGGGRAGGGGGRGGR